MLLLRKQITVYLLLSSDSNIVSHGVIIDLMMTTSVQLTQIIYWGYTVYIF